jgi:hypothetical protein
MELSPQETHTHYDKMGFPIKEKEEIAINYLVDAKAEEKRLMRWEKLLPHINELKNGGR